MLKLVAVSTVALSALAASIPFAHATGDCPDGAKCGMQFAAEADVHAALLQSAESSARALALAIDLAHYGETAQSPAALLVAAGMMADLNVTPMAGPAISLSSNETLLDEARGMAGDDAVILAMIDDQVAERERGSTFAVEAFDGQGGESWVDAGDSTMFTRSYSSDTDAVLTLVAAPTADLAVRVVTSQGELVCEGQMRDGAHSCVWPANADADYAIQVSNRADASTSFTIWTN